MTHSSDAMQRLIGVLFCAGCAAHQAATTRVGAAPTAPAAAVAPAPRCRPTARALSALGRGGAHPDVATATGGSELGVVWEETADDHRGVHFVALDDKLGRLGPSVEVADLPRGGADPLVLAADEGYLVLWSDGQAVQLRRVDRVGRPLSDVLTMPAPTGARLLAASAAPCKKAPCEGPIVLGWRGSQENAPLMLTRADRHGRAQGPPIELSRTVSIDPALRLRARADGSLIAAWVELVDDARHVFAAEVRGRAVAPRSDLGPGERPFPLLDAVLLQRLPDSSVWKAPLAGGAPVRIGTGATLSAAMGPDPAGPVGVCLAGQSAEDGGEELRCQLGSGSEAAIAMAHARYGFLEARAASLGSTIAVAYQTEDDQPQVSVAALKCD